MQKHQLDSPSSSKEPRHEVKKFELQEQLPSPLSIKRSSFEDLTASHNNFSGNRKRKVQSLCLDCQPSEPPRKRSRSLDEFSKHLHESLTHKRVKCEGTNTTLQNNENSGEQQKITSSPKSGKIFIEERVTHKRQAESGDEGDRKRRRRLHSEEVPGSLTDWLESLPASTQEFEDMSQPPIKRTRSQSGERSSQSDNGSESTVPRSKKYSTYENPRYETVLENKNSFMRESKQGPLSEERAFYKTLFTRTQPVPAEPAFEEQLLSRFLTLLQNRSELHVCVLLHSRLVPPAEYLSLFEPQKFDGLIDGYNECWDKAIVFYKTLPQPDHTVAYRDSVLTVQQRRKLGILPEVSSLFAGREGTCFPFFTCEVKCGKQALDVADRANANSMTIALRGVVELYRRAGRVMDVHRRILGFSISHDDKSVRIYGHYPEIEGEKTSYYRHRIRGFELEENDGEQKWTTYTFVYNLYTKFAPEHIERIKKVVDLLPDPLSQSFDSATVLDDSQGALSTAPTSQQEFAKPGLPQGRATNAQLKQQLQQLIVQLEQQRKESEQQRKELLAQSEQQRKELMTQLEQQREQSGQLMQLLKQQSEEAKAREQRLTEQLKELMKGR